MFLVSSPFSPHLRLCLSFLGCQPCVPVCNFKLNVSGLGAPCCVYGREHRSAAWLFLRTRSEVWVNWSSVHVWACCHTCLSLSAGSCSLGCPWKPGHRAWGLNTWGSHWVILESAQGAKSCGHFSPKYPGWRGVGWVSFFVYLTEYFL